MRFNWGLSPIISGTAGGISSTLNGGKFGHGFASAGFTQALGNVKGLFAEGGGRALAMADRVGNAVKASIIGGTASVISGGKFASGAVTGAFSRLLNDNAAEGEGYLKEENGCIDSCHGNDYGDAEVMPESEQRNMAVGVGVSAATTVLSGGLAVVYNSAKGIYYTYKVVNGARTLVSASKARVATLATSAVETAIVAGAPVVTSPRVQQGAIDLTTSLFPGTPVMSLQGIIGGLVGSQSNPQELLRK